MHVLVVLSLPLAFLAAFLGVAALVVIAGWEPTARFLYSAKRFTHRFVRIARAHNDGRVP
jgi:hypothetical protein